MVALRSSPSLRRTRTIALDGDLQRPIIPAHAGNTAKGTDQVPRSAVHPRPRGEHSQCQPARAVHPRARGEHIPGNVCILSPSRSSPRAGNTCRNGVLTFIAADHPRARNTLAVARKPCPVIVHPLRGTHTLQAIGSGVPPPTPSARGTPLALSTLVRPAPLIPACGEHLTA